MAQITALSLFVINRVKLLRLINGIPASRLSVFLKHTPAYVFNVEKIELPTQYSPHEWPKIAEGLHCEIHDLLPPKETEEQSTGKLVEKTILNLDNETDIKLIIEGLVKHGYFNLNRSLTETAKHLFIDSVQQSTLLENGLTAAVKEKTLELEGIQYIKAKHSPQ